MGRRSDAELLEAVAAMVSHGEYLDDLPGTRGSAKQLEAKRKGLVDRLPPLVPAEPGDVEEAEAMIGHQIPSLLRRLYLEVGNGGFGPGYGILGLRNGHKDDTRRTAVDLYRQAHDGPEAWWPFLQPGLLPICHWGCAIYSLVDCSDPDGPMWGWDPNPGPDDETALFPGEFAFADWLDKWIDGRLFQPALVQEEATGTWRGATDAEMERWMGEDDVGR